MPPLSPDPGWANGDVCNESTARRRTISYRTPRSGERFLTSPVIYDKATGGRGQVENRRHGAWRRVEAPGRGRLRTFVHDPRSADGLRAASAALPQERPRAPHERA